MCTWPHKGGAPAINDLIAGRVQVMFESLNSIAPFARSGAVRALAVGSDHRSAAFPDLPTIAESGVPGYEAGTWTGVIAPAGVPRPIVDKLNGAVVAALAEPAVREKLASVGLDGPPAGQEAPEALATFQKAEVAKWWPIIRAANVTAE